MGGSHVEAYFHFVYFHPTTSTHRKTDESENFVHAFMESSRWSEMGNRHSMSISVMWRLAGNSGPLLRQPCTDSTSSNKPKPDVGKQGIFDRARRTDASKPS
jgi:hypothetical protein